MWCPRRRENGNAEEAEEGIPLADKLVSSLARGELHQATEFIDLFLIGLALRKELHTVIVAAAMTNHSLGPGRGIGIWWRELNSDFVSRPQLLTGEDQHSALAYVAGPSVRDADVFVTIDDQANRQLQAVAQPAPEDGFFLSFLCARLRTAP